MLDASWGDTRWGGGPSIAAPITMPVVTVAAAASEANMHPPSSDGVAVTTTAITTAADVADNARCNPDANVDGGPSPSALGDDADNGGQGKRWCKQLLCPSS